MENADAGKKEKWKGVSPFSDFTFVVCGSIVKWAQSLKRSEIYLHIDMNGYYSIPCSPADMGMDYLTSSSGSRRPGILILVANRTFSRMRNAVVLFTTCYNYSNNYLTTYI